MRKKIKSRREKESATNENNLDLTTGEIMQKLIVFNHVSLDSYFVYRNNEMSGAKADHNDQEWNAFVSENASGGGTLVFGRITYEMMASFWPTQFAIEQMPVVAAGMN